MKILLVSNMYPTKNHPYYGIFVKHTADLLKSGGFSVELSVMKKEKRFFQKLFSYVLFYITTLLKGLFGNHDVMYVHYASHTSLPVLILKKIKPSIRIVTNVHGSDVRPSKPQHPALKMCSTSLLHRSERVIAPSNSFKRYVHQTYLVPLEKIVVFPSGGVDASLFYEKKDKHAAKIGFIGRMESSKGWKVFLEAISSLKEEGKLKKKSVIMVGSGKDDAACNDFIKEKKLGEYVARIPMVGQEALRDIYGSMHVFCFPSRAESLGLVGLEAMSCGVPVIGSRINGITDYIEDQKNGYLFEPDHSDDLKEKIEKVFSLDPETYSRLKKAAKKTAKMYEKKVVQPDFLTLFNDLQHEVKT